MSRNPHNLFLIEYAHVRCCALLRLGEREGLIRLVSKDLTDLTWPCQDPNGIPWLMDSQQLRFTHQADFSLLNQLVITSDRWANDASVTWTKLATQLSESILNFERYCRIFGELTQVDPQLSQGRLGLLAVSQQILKWLWFSHQADLPRSSM